MINNLRKFCSYSLFLLSSLVSLPVLMLGFMLILFLVLTYSLFLIVAAMFHPEFKNRLQELETELEREEYEAS